jgi:hypothetical protein
MKHSLSILVALCAGLAGCGRGDRPPAEATRPPVAADWRAVATQQDRERLRKWRDAWVDALGQVRAAGRMPQLTPLGTLFDPDLALPGALPPDGAYRCRVFKLGAKAPGLGALTSYPYFDCTIDAEGELHSLYKRTGSQRPVGLIFPDGASRAVFLGTLMLGDETAALQYGIDGKRDMAGVIERVGERRWRLALPYPAFESTLDVVELVPAG